MKTSSLSILLTCLFLLSCCSPLDPAIAENEEVALVEQHHTNSLGAVNIVSVSYEDGRYIVEWEKKTIANGESIMSMDRAATLK